MLIKSSRHGHHVNLEKLTRENADFRRVLYTGKSMQLVLMCLAPSEEIGLETHPENDQFFRFETGEGKVVVNEFEYPVSDGDSVIVPMGAKHNVINLSGTEPLKFYTIYSPAHHEDGTVHKTKAEAEKDEEEFDGKVSEG
jgi:mannose-6-phosphate isomerase-like protein (cupin superfamily)